MMIRNTLNAFGGSKSKRYSTCLLKGILMWVQLQMGKT